MQNYDRHERVGHGLFSDVYHATDRRTAAAVALKITIPVEDRPPHDSRAEAATLRRLAESGGHCGVVPLIESFDHVGADTELVMVMPLFALDLDGVLKKHAKARYPSGWRNGLAEGLAVGIVAKLCSALAFVHAHGVIHRDIKPGNVMFRADDLCNPVLVDFGTAWAEPDNGGREPRGAMVTQVATAEYRAPELLLGITTYGPAVDVWAAGVVLCKLLSRDLSVPLLAPYRSDIALLSALFDALGTPPADSWPDEHDLPLSGTTPRPGLADPWASLAPLGSSQARCIISRLLRYGPASRLSASDAADQLAALASSLAS